MVAWGPGSKGEWAPIHLGDRLGQRMGVVPQVVQLVWVVLASLLAVPERMVQVALSCINLAWNYIH